MQAYNKHSLGNVPLQVCNEQCFDLLDPSSNPKDIRFTENTSGFRQAKGLRAVTVHSEAEALECFFEVSLVTGFVDE